MLITKKRTGYLVLLFALIGLSETVQAYTFSHTFKNKTPHKVRIKAEYLTGLCTDEDFELRPRSNKTIGVGYCTLTKVDATIYEKDRTVQARGDFDFPGTTDIIIEGPSTSLKKYKVFLDY